MNDFTGNLLAWLIPPAVGALIGYITNAIAIKMLFRPLTEKRVFGVRVPFTPGILPRQRRKLADSIGRMVERELLTPEILRERLARPEVKDGFKKALAGFTGVFLGRPIASWLPAVSGHIEGGTRAVYPYVSAAVVRFLRRDDIRGLIEAKLRIVVTNAKLNLNVFQRLVVEAGYDKVIDEKIPAIVNDLVNQLESLLESEEGRAMIVGTIKKEIDSLPQKNPDLTPEQMLARLPAGEDSREKLDSFLAEKILDAAGGQTEALLAAINIKTLVSQRIDSLDMLRVERIILDVLAGQLWWINIFGGILGLLIGLFQAGLSRFL